MDQFASKIVEKCLKIGGSDFLDRYLSRVCTGRADRPRMPLIDSKFDTGLFFSFFLSFFSYGILTNKKSQEISMETISSNGF